MSATATKRKKRVGRQTAGQIAHNAMKTWLAKLPKDIAADLEELFSMIAKAKNEQERKEIAATITELLYPDTLIVEIEKSYKLDHEEAARKKLESYRQSVGKQIEKHRIAKKMSQAKLGALVGISQSHVCRLETGVHVPTHTTIERIAKVLGVCASQLDPGFESSVGQS